MRPSTHPPSLSQDPRNSGPTAPRRAHTAAQWKPTAWTSWRRRCGERARWRSIWRSVAPRRARHRSRPRAATSDSCIPREWCTRRTIPSGRAGRADAAALGAQPYLWSSDDSACTARTWPAPAGPRRRLGGVERCVYVVFPAVPCALPGPQCSRTAREMPSVRAVASASRSILKKKYYGKTTS